MTWPCAFKNKSVPFFPGGGGGDGKGRRRLRQYLGLLSDLLWSIFGLIERGQAMKLSSRTKPISYLKANAAEIVRNLGEGREPLVITQSGEAKVVIQDIESYEQPQESMALLKILALGNRQTQEGRVRPLAEVGPLRRYRPALQ